MKYLARIGVIVAACLAMADMACAVDPSQPFVMLTVPDGGINLGGAAGPGWKQLGGQVVANVVANCPYHIEASFQGLSHAYGRATILPKHLRVQINGETACVGQGYVSIAAANKPTPTAGVDVPIDLQVGVTGLTAYPPGAYNGVLVVRVTAGPSSEWAGFAANAVKRK